MENFPIARALLDGLDLDLVGFSLSGKIAGRICGLALTQVRTTRRQSLPQPEWAQDFDALDRDLGQGPTQDLSADLSAYLALHQLIRQAYPQAKGIGETFKYLATQPQSQPAPADVAMISEAAGVEAARLRAVWASRENHSRMSDIHAALQVVRETQPRDGRPSDWVMTLKSALKGTKKGVALRARDTEVVLAQLGYLTDLERKVS